MSTWIPGQDQAERIKTLYLTQAEARPCQCGGIIYVPEGRWHLIPEQVRRHQRTARHTAWSREQGY